MCEGREAKEWSRRSKSKGLVMLSLTEFAYDELGAVVRRQVQLRMVMKRKWAQVMKRDQGWVQIVVDWAHVRLRGLAQVRRELG